MLKIFIMLFILYSSLFSKAFDVSNLNEIENLDNIEYINDENNQYTYEDILNKDNLNLLKITHIGPAIGPFWTKTTLINSSNITKEITLYNPLAGMNKIDVYILRNNKLSEILYLGDLRPQELRNNLSTYSSFNLTINPSESIIIISKIENFYIYNLGWRISNIYDFSSNEIKKIYFAGLFGSLILIFSFYNILSFFLYKNKSYLIVFATGFSLFLYQYGFHGILYFLNINLNLELITFITWNSSSFGGIFLLLFTYTFFEQRKKYKKSSCISIFLILLYIICILLLTYAQFFNEKYFKYAWLLTVLFISSTFYLFIFAIFTLIKKESEAIYYILGKSIFFLVVFINTLGLFNLILYEDIIKFLIPFAYIIDLLVLVVILYLKNKHEQEELIKAKMILLEQSRFNSIGQAIGQISHQWKSPLTSIGTSITLLETIYNHDSDRLILTFEKQLPFMKKSIDLMKKSIDEFSNFYETKNEKEDFILKNLILDIINILNSKIILKKVKIILDIEDNFKINSFEHILSNIFLILINNSLEEFSDREENRIEIDAKIINTKIIINYKDNAGGIKINPIESVFDYFTSSKKGKEKSSGFGLAIAKMLVNDKLYGTIEVKNIGDCAIFTITLPLGTVN
ncbi:7TM diverse intracellular signaling domain-containing protein [Aliarcobacter cibarius]|uniref:histidine kinase n=1 Tax=Aliarcobacter cibarius TaxID=255507 RepID=A0A7L5JLG7_9BACT|nr:sensor histidine kinase [Aliarcobacter cibarius]QKJ26065.1 7TMR-DISM-7TM/7TMR-DISMED2 domain-containing two-component system sensor histidine kinase [Aliarcobacter cibarius]TLT02517.1 hypothetical protein FE248_10100 [Aliarcobacter cibarius]